MAGAKSRKKKFVVRLELGAKGLLATGVVCFCVLLWMFLLGIWAGDHLASSGGGDDDFSPVVKPLTVNPAPASPAGSIAEPITVPLAPALKPSARKVEKREILPRAAKVSRGKKKRRQGIAPTRATSGGSFFTLQVGAYSKKTYAIEEVARLKARDLAAFLRSPGSGRGRFIRVYIGQYPTMAAARTASAAIEKEQGIKSFVVMIPGGTSGK